MAPFKETIASFLWSCFDSMVTACTRLLSNIFISKTRFQCNVFVVISTDAALTCLVIVSPFVAGLLFGKSCTAVLFSGALVTGVQLAIYMSNTGGAWDNAIFKPEHSNQANLMHVQLIRTQPLVIMSVIPSRILVDLHSIFSSGCPQSCHCFLVLPSQAFPTRFWIKHVEDQKEESEKHT